MHAYKNSKVNKKTPPALIETKIPTLNQLFSPGYSSRGLDLPQLCPLG